MADPGKWGWCEVEVAFYAETSRSAHRFELGEGEVSPFLGLSHNETEEYTRLRVEFGGVPCEVGPRREELDDHDRVLVSFLASKPCKEDHMILEKHFHTLSR